MCDPSDQANPDLCTGMAHQERDQPDPSPDGLEDRLTLREVSAPSEFSNVPGEEPFQQGPHSTLSRLFTARGTT